MPIYDYECKDCNVGSSVVARISDTITAPICTECGQDMVRKFNLGAVTFKGSGFYRTDRNKREE